MLSFENFDNLDQVKYPKEVININDLRIEDILLKETKNHHILSFGHDGIYVEIKGKVSIHLNGIIIDNPNWIFQMKIDENEKKSIDKLESFIVNNTESKKKEESLKIFYQSLFPNSFYIKEFDSIDSLKSIIKCVTVDGKSTSISSQIEYEAKMILHLKELALMKDLLVINNFLIGCTLYSSQSSPN